MLIRPGAIGDFILSLPALQFLRAEWTEVWCAEPNVPLAKFADAALSIGSAGLDRMGILPDDDVRSRLARFDEIHSWYGAARPEFRDEVSAFPFRFYQAIPSAAGEHATDFYCRQVGAPLGQTPSIPFRANHSGLTIIHPFASNPAKRWPMERFRRLAAMLENVAWCAGPEESLADAVRIGHLGELARWIAGASLFIGNDSGITHLAAAVGTPTLAIFGPTDPAVWAPRAPHVRVVRRLPLETLAEEEVFALAQTLI